jgi:hypothetical protein
MLSVCPWSGWETALRQHHFGFLVGDPDRNGRCRRLPVDAYYPKLHLVIEYREKQHSEAVRIMDRKMTISSCPRGEQRRAYDQRRRAVLTQHHIALVELDYSMFAHDSRKRLRRNEARDREVLKTRLGKFIAR